MGGVVALSMLVLVVAGVLVVYSAISTPDTDPERPRALVVILGSAVILVGFLGFVLLTCTP
jgi:hypothetical protein